MAFEVLTCSFVGMTRPQIEEEEDAQQLRGANTKVKNGS